jgi:hypothetical protein
MVMSGSKLNIVHRAVGRLCYGRVKRSAVRPAELETHASGNQKPEPPDGPVQKSLTMPSKMSGTVCTSDLHSTNSKK